MSYISTKKPCYDDCILVTVTYCLLDVSEPHNAAQPEGHASEEELIPQAHSSTSIHSVNESDTASSAEHERTTHTGSQSTPKGTSK